MSTIALASSPPSATTRPHTAVSASTVLRTTAGLVADLDPDDPAWSRVGPRLTAVVDGVSRAVVGTGSPIAPGEDVAPILRLRDLARVAHVALRAPREPMPPRVADRLDALIAVVAD